jgi:hypothetical protein
MESDVDAVVGLPLPPLQAVKGSATSNIISERERNLRMMDTPVCIFFSVPHTRTKVNSAGKKTLASVGVLCYTGKKQKRGTS